MKKILLLVLVVILISCRVIPIWEIANIKSNPFLVEIDLTKTGHKVMPLISDGILNTEKMDLDITVESIIRFPVISDVHSGRDDSGTIFHIESFMRFLEEGNYPFLVNLGDLIDEGHFEDSEVIDFYSETANMVNGNHIWCIGNHELHNETSESFDLLLSSFYPDKETIRMCKYVYGPLSIYKLDNSLGVFGKEQIDYLENALADDKNPFKIFVAHGNMVSGGHLDHSMIITGMADQREVHRILRLMDKYGVSLIFTGHHHKGNIAYRFSDVSAELNIAAFHERDTSLDIESDGSFYLVELDTSNKTINVIEFSAKTGKQKNSFLFNC